MMQPVRVRHAALKFHQKTKASSLRGLAFLSCLDICWIEKENKVQVYANWRVKRYSTNTIQWNINIVKYIIVDKSISFRDVVRSYFPRAEVIADKFNICQSVTCVMENVQKRVKKQFRSGRRKYFKKSLAIVEEAAAEWWTEGTAKHHAHSIRWSQTELFEKRIVL